MPGLRPRSYCPVFGVTYSRLVCSHILPKGGFVVSWSKPKAREVKCGMEINMYGPAEDDRDARESI